VSCPNALGGRYCGLGQAFCGQLRALVDHPQDPGAFRDKRFRRHFAVCAPSAAATAAGSLPCGHVSQRRRTRHTGFGRRRHYARFCRRGHRGQGRRGRDYTRLGRRRYRSRFK
jgi:hypothetical protein